MSFLNASICPPSYLYDVVTNPDLYHRGMDRDGRDDPRLPFYVICHFGVTSASTTKHQSIRPRAMPTITAATCQSWLEEDLYVRTTWVA